MSKNKDKNQQEPESRRGAVGGQAVIEGVMMKYKDNVAISVRRENGEIVKKLNTFKPLKEKYKILGVPIIRGVVNFIEMLSMSMSTLNESAEMLGLDEELGKDEKKEKIDLKAKLDKIGEIDSLKSVYEEARKDAISSVQKKEGEKKSPMVLIASIVGTVLGLALAIVLFFILPTFIGGKITDLTGFEKGGWFISLMEGLTRLAIFIAYILLVTLIPDIKRTFQYHGAEHMSVFCYEAEDELTVENAKKYSRFHPRCGTSFLIVMMIIGIIISMFIPNFTKLGFSNVAAYWLRLLVKFLVFPFIIGIGYEFIRYAGKHDSVIVKIVSAPGLWIQRLTTKKPDDKQLEVALDSLRVAVNIDPVETETANSNVNKDDEIVKIQEANAE